MPRVLVVTPKAVGPAWQKQAGIVAEGKYTLRRHQQPASDNIREKDRWFVAHGMGCGKTITCLDGLGFKGVNFKFCDLTHATPAVKRRVLESARTEQTVVVVVNYESVISKTCKDLISKVAWDAIVLDESHKAKSAGSKVSRYLHTIGKRCGKKVCLTGTPMPNSPLDLYGQLRFLGVVQGNWGAFRARYAVTHPDYPSLVLRYQNLEELSEKFDCVCSKAEAAEFLDLPETVHCEVPVVLSPLTRRVYDELEREFVAEHQGNTVAVDNPLTKILRLHQLAGGYLNDQPILKTPEKAEALKEVIEHDQPVVVFCRFTKDLQSVAEVAGDDYRELSGQRHELESWQKGEGRVLGVQISCGGAGIDLTRSAHCVFYSLGYSLGDYEQACARLHRPGQERTVFYHHLVAQGTIDEKIYLAIRNKRNIVEEVMNCE